MLPSQFARALAIAVGLLYALATVPAYARGTSEDESVRSERTLGTVALNLGKYDEAVEHFSRAYSIVQDPALLFSLAQAYRIGGKADKALAAYSAFLRAVGNNNKYRGQIERAADEIESLTSFMLNHPVDSRKTEKPATVVENTAPAKEVDNPAIEPPPTENTAEAQPALPVVATKVETPIPLPTPEALPALALVLVSEKAQPLPEKKDHPLYGRWWFWTGVAGVIAAGSVAVWYYSQPTSQPPASTYGSVRVLP